MGTVLSQVWKDLRVNLTNDLDKPARCTLNVFDENTGNYETVHTTRLLNVGERITVTIPEWILRDYRFRDNPVLPGHTVWIRPAHWRDAMLVETYKTENSNQIVYQALVAPAEVIIIPAEIIIGVAAIKFIK